MKRKFSFDIPKLKFGPSKQETQALKQHLASRKSFDSDPPTPKSVRPPLSSVTEAELKAACTWVVANYRPSHIPHKEPVGIGVSRQYAVPVDHAALNAAVRREREEQVPEVPQWPSVPSDIVRVDENGSQWPSSEMFTYKPTEASKDLFHRDEFEVMRQQRNSIMQKADELMTNLEETQKVLLSPELRSHTRTASNQSKVSVANRDIAQLQTSDPRSDSVGTVISTPRTDVTGSAWPGSTAPTSAYVTPAHQSKRTSHTQSDTHLPPKVVTAVDAEWMRQELEKHLKAQDEELTRQESPVSEAAGLAETTPTQIAQTPKSPQSIKRKPLPRRGTGESQQNFSLRADSRQSKAMSRPQSQVESMPTSPTIRQVIERPATSGREWTGDDRRSSRAKSITQEVRNFARPSTAQTAIRSEADVYQPRSRAMSTQSQVQNFSRPSMDGSRKVSIDISRPVSRARSTDSFRSAVSAISSGEENSAKPWRKSLGRRLSQDSERSAGNADYERSFASNRGRLFVPRQSPSPPIHPPVNLDRELPPLPGLDQWKLIEPENASPERPAPNEDEHDSGMEHEHTKSHQFPRRKDSLVNRKPRHLTTASPAAPQTYAPRQSVYLEVADNLQSDDQPLAPANTRDPTVAATPALSPDFREQHRRSRAVVDATSPDLAGPMSSVSLGQIHPELRPRTRQLHSATSIPSTAAEKRLSRPLSSAADIAPNFSRKLSSSADGPVEMGGDWGRMRDTRYQHMMEITPTLGTWRLSGVEGKKRRWWQGGRAKSARAKNEENWMDAVVKSGSRSGVLLTDEVAGAPIVRY